MSRSRSFNRFHRSLASAKRRSQRSYLPRFRDQDVGSGSSFDHTQMILNRLWGREMRLELLEHDV